MSDGTVHPTPPDRGLGEAVPPRFVSPRSVRFRATSDPLWGSTARMAAGGPNGVDEPDPEPPPLPSPQGRASVPAGGRNLVVATAVGVLLAVVFLGSLLWSPAAFTAVVVLFVVVAVAETGNELRRIGWSSSIPAMAIGGTVTVIGAYRSGHTGQVAGLLVLFLGAIVWLLADPGRRDIVRNLATTVTLGVWTGFLASFAVLLVNRPQDGAVAVLAVIGAAVLGDIGGYLVGVRIGRTKIAPNVSPNKSLEGLVGGVVFAGGIGAIVLPLVGDLFTPASAAAVAVACALAGFVGDLAESMVKRDLGLKDLGSLLPGHGGILDRVDSILVALPVGFFAIALLT